MEEQVLLLPPTYKLNKEWGIFLATFLGGPLAGAFLIAENFRRLDQPMKAKWTWGIAILVMVFLLSMGFVPVLKDIPSAVYGVISVAIAQILVRKFQSPAIQLHIQEGGALYPAGRAVIAALIGFVLVVGGLVGFYYWISRAAA